MKLREKVAGVFNKDLTVRLIDELSVVALSATSKFRKANT
jgi:hypothetical protein